MKASVGKRVLMLLENNPYPADRRVRQEAGVLVAAGYRVAVVCPAEPDQPWRETVDGVRVWRYPAPPQATGFLGYLVEYGYATVATFLLSLVVYLTGGFDVVHAHNPPDTLVLIGAFYKALGKRFVFDHHDLSPEMYYARFPDRRNRIVYAGLVLFEKLSCRIADHVIATNESYKRVEIERGRVRPDRITIVRNGPDLDRFRPVPPDPELRARSPNIIAFAGVIGFQDGVDYLLRALRSLVSDLKRTDFLCVVIGTGDAAAASRRLATELGLDRYVWFTGWVSDEDFLRYLSTADICVAPDPANPFTDRSTMIKTMNYMALGKPIVAFDLTEHRISAQDAALYARPNDVRAFAAALAALMDDPAKRRAMGELGQRRVERDLAWCYSVPRLLSAYETVTAQADRRQPVTPSSSPQAGYRAPSGRGGGAGGGDRSDLRAS